MGRSWLIALALCGVLGLVGCGGDDGDDRAGTPATTAAPEETADDGAAPSPTAEPTTTAEPETQDPLVARTVKARTRKTTTLDIAVQSLQVTGKLATLELSFTPHDSDAESYDSSIADLNSIGGGPPQIALVDPVNLKRYVVVNDAADNDLESLLAVTRPEPDATAVTTHTFAAPPPDVTKIDVAVADFTTFHDVPIER
jgi:hypothetical protein